LNLILIIPENPKFDSLFQQCPSSGALEYLRLRKGEIPPRAAENPNFCAGVLYPVREGSTLGYLLPLMKIKGLHGLMV